MLFCTGNVDVKGVEGSSETSIGRPTESLSLRSVWSSSISHARDASTALESKLSNETSTLAGSTGMLGIWSEGMAMDRTMRCFLEQRLSWPEAVGCLALPKTLSGRCRRICNRAFIVSVISNGDFSMEGNGSKDLESV